MTTIHEFYTKIKPIVSPQDRWLFQKSEKIKIKERYDDQIAWIDAVSRVCKTNIENLKLEIPSFLVREQQVNNLSFL